MAKSKTQTLARVSKTQRDIDQTRYIRVRRLSYTPEEVAEQDGVELDEVKRSIISFETHIGLNSMEMLQQQEAGVVLFATEAQKQVLDEALKAKKPVLVNGVHQRDSKGVAMYEPDHDVRMKALDIINKKIEVIQPKSRGGVSVAVGMGFTGGGSGSSRPAPPVNVRRFEDRLRDINDKRRAANLLPTGEPEKTTGPLDAGEGEIVVDPNE